MSKQDRTYSRTAEDLERKYNLGQLVQGYNASNNQKTIINASGTNYDNQKSGLESTTVQGAVDELSNSVDGLNDSVNELNSNLGGLRFGYDGDSNSYGYYEADDSFVPFSQGCKLLWADYESESQAKGTFINVDLSRYSKVLIALENSRSTPFRTYYVFDVGITKQAYCLNNTSGTTHRTITISTSGISIDACQYADRAILTEVYGWEESENNDYVYSGNFLGVFYSNVNSTFTFDTSLVGDSCILAIVQYNSNNTSTVAQMTAYENCTVELLQNTMNSYHSIYVYKITDIVEGAYIKHSGSRNILLFK